MDDMLVGYIKPKSTVQVVQYLKLNDIYNIILVKSNKGFHFTGGESDLWPDNPIVVNKVSDLSLFEWLREYDERKQRYSKV